MPYNYLTINESGLNSGLVSASYFDVELQSLYEQQYSTNEIFFGDSDDDLIEFSLYNSGQEPLSFNRVAHGRHLVRMTLFYCKVFDEETA